MGNSNRRAPNPLTCDSDFIFKWQQLNTKVGVWGGVWTASDCFAVLKLADYESQRSAACMRAQGARHTFKAAESSAHSA